MPELVYSETRHRAAWAERSDRELLEGIRDRDESALDELITRKAGPLVQLAYRIVGDREEARDVVQVALFRVWDQIERFDARWSPNTWIYRIVNNLAIDHLRSRRSRERQVEPVRRHLRQVAAGHSHRIPPSLDGSEVAGIFRELAGELTDKQRSVFILRELEGLSSKEVAEVVDCRESTVRNHLFNARKVLRKALLERYPEYARRYAPEPDGSPDPDESPDEVKR
ncbi:MAG: RNA polymerase sigma factor [Acidobacteriota bacterium]|jgi:RNA polymerase sigma-70 factor (ECF subfamily)